LSYEAGMNLQKVKAFYKDEKNSKILPGI